MATKKKPRPGSAAANAQGFINTYNAHQHSGAYGTPQYAATYDPSQGFGTPQKPGPPPIDWQQQQAEAAQTRGVQYADAQATFDRGRINRDFGYGADGQADPNNPYSKAALLNRNFQAQQAGDTNGFAAQGQLYSGALQNQKNATTFGYLSDSNALKNQYNDALNQTNLNQLGAYTSAGSAISQDKIAAILRALGQA